MKKSANNLDVKKTNKNQLFRYLNDKDECCMSEIAKALKISRPTVLSLVNELKEAGIVEEIGEYQSTGGRKAKAIATVKTHQYSIGVDITREHVAITYTNLAKTRFECEKIYKLFDNTEKYFRELGDLIRKFVKKNRIPAKKICGIGISAPVIVDKQTDRITNSHALNVHNEACKNWEIYLPYPSVILNDANAAAWAEWNCKEQAGNMVYLSLSNTVGGAVIYHFGRGEYYEGEKSFNGFSNIYLGEQWRSSEFGHILIHPGEKKCYCGKLGCADAYCSAMCLAKHADGSLEAFFEELEKGGKEYREIWEKYLDDLALLVDTLRMIFDMDIIIGGYVGGRIERYMPMLQKRLEKLNIFDGRGDYAHACSCTNEASAFGAAIYQMEQYVESI